MAQAVHEGVLNHPLNNWVIRNTGKGEEDKSEAMEDAGEGE